MDKGKDCENNGKIKNIGTFFNFFSQIGNFNLKLTKIMFKLIIF